MRCIYVAIIQLIQHVKGEPICKSHNLAELRFIRTNMSQHNTMTVHYLEYYTNIRTSKRQNLASISNNS